jgi:CHAT domain-containing protein
MPRHDLRDLGLQLWCEALPVQVQQRFDDLVDSADSLTVMADEHYDIPWELLLPTPAGRAETPFLAETLPVLRGITGQSYQRVLRIREAAYVCQARLSDTDTEVAEVQRLLGGQVSHRRPSFARAGDLVHYIDTGRFDLLHLACHNDHPRWGWQAVAMADDPFYCFNLQSAIKNKALSDRQPMIFFNACNTNSRPADTHLAGWAENFLLAGAGGFIGSAFAVPSGTAKDYAVALYSALGDPAVASNLGRASLSARRTLSASGDPTRLAYAVYARVDTVVKWG